MLLHNKRRRAKRARKFFKFFTPFASFKCFFTIEFFFYIFEKWGGPGPPWPPPPRFLRPCYTAWFNLRWSAQLAIYCRICAKRDNSGSCMSPTLNSQFTLSMANPKGVSSSCSAVYTRHECLVQIFTFVCSRPGFAREINFSWFQSDSRNFWKLFLNPRKTR